MSQHEPPRFPDEWQVDEASQRATLVATAPSFLAALALFREVGDIAERLDHHPDLHLEEYKKVRIVTFSHDVGRLTARDQRLAREISDLVAERGWKSG